MCKYLLDGLALVIDIAKLLRGPRAQIRYKYLLLCKPLSFVGNGLCQRVGVLLVVKAQCGNSFNFLERKAKSMRMQ